MITAPTRSSAWFLVARNVGHMDIVKNGSVTWWCVTRKAAVGDKCFLYKSLTGIIVHFEVLRLTEPQGFCTGYEMATAQVRVLRVFKPPIMAKALKASSVIAKQGFVRRNFQGKAFVVEENAAKAILKL
jgi:hypothetical protein